MPITLLEIRPFQTGRFFESYGNDPETITKTGLHSSITGETAYQDCLLIGNEFSARGELVPKSVLLYTSYTVSNSNGPQVFITEYKRRLSRIISHAEFRTDPQGTLAKCGHDIINKMDRLLQSYPLSKDFDFWIELEANSENAASNDDDVASEIPLLALYVVETVKPTAFSDHSQRYTLPYKNKRRLFVEAMRMAFTLLHYQSFAQLLGIGNFLIRQNPDNEELFTAMSTPTLFTDFLKFVFNTNTDNRALRMLVRKNRTLQKKSLQLPLYVTLRTFMGELFEKEEGHEWRDRKDDLPTEMYMLYAHLQSDIKLLHGNELAKLVKQLEYPYVTTRIECFEKLEILGSGSFGDVFLARHKGSNVKLAIKVIKNYKQSVAITNKLLENLKMISQFDHKNVVKHYDAWTSDYHYAWIVENTEDDTEYVGNSVGSTFQTAQEDWMNVAEHPDQSDWNCNHRYTFIVLEACSGSLYSLMKKIPLTEEQCIRYMKEFINGIQYLNELGFMHRDVKPQNALISNDGRLLVSDLDTVKRLNSKDEHENIPQTIVRTPAYVSPEMKNRSYNERTDYYSIGVTFAQMLCPEHSRDIKGFINHLHEDRLSHVMHPQYSFLIRWLTEADPTDRIGFLSFATLYSLLERHQYDGWQPRAVNPYLIYVEHQHTGEIMQCVRVSNRKDTVREVIKRYSKRPEDSRTKTKQEFRIRIEPAFAFETSIQLNIIGQEQKSLELQEGRLVLVNSQVDYVYICYTLIEFEDQFIGEEYYVDWIREMMVSHFDMLTRWGAYGFTSISRCAFKPESFLIEPNMLDVVSAEYIRTHIALFWPPQKIFNLAPMSEAGSIFSFGLFLLWNIFSSLEVPQDDIILSIRELQDGIRPVSLGLIEPYMSQLILWLCAHDPLKRPLKRNIPFMFEGLIRPPTIDKKFLFRLNFEDIKFTEELLSDGTVVQHLTKSLWKAKGRQLNCTRKMNASIYSISNGAGVMEKVTNRLKISGHFHAYPRKFVKLCYKDINEPLQSLCMLDTNENDELVVVPRCEDAVDWFISERGTDYPDVRETIAIRRLELPYIHNTFCEVLRHLEDFHKRGIYHGNINFDTFLVSEDGSMFCLANPILVESDTDFCSRNCYLTDYSSPEQKSTHIGSAASDVFSLGVTLYSLLCFYHDVAEPNVHMFQNDGKVTFPEQIETEYCELIRKMTCFDQDLRIDCSQALQIFSSTCRIYLEQAKSPESKLKVDTTIKTDAMLLVTK